MWVREFAKIIRSHYSSLCGRRDPRLLQKLFLFNVIRSKPLKNRDYESLVK